MANRSSLHRTSQRRDWAVRGFLAALILICAYLIFEFGRIQADYNVIDAAQQRQAYEVQIAELELEILRLNEQVTLLETHRDIDREAYRDVEASLGRLQEKIQEQRDLIAFYRGIVSPADGRAGLRVQMMKLSRVGDERAYNVRLVLIQSMRHDRKVSGDVAFSIEGDHNGRAVTYAYQDLLPDDAETAWPFSFRYFQDFDRTIVLPEGFNPERIKIEVRSKTRSIGSIEENYSWARSLS